MKHKIPEIVKQELAKAWDATFANTIVPRSNWTSIHEKVMEMPNYFEMFITELEKLAWEETKKQNAK